MPQTAEYIVKERGSKSDTNEYEVFVAKECRQRAYNAQKKPIGRLVQNTTWGRSGLNLEFSRPSTRDVI